MTASLFFFKQKLFFLEKKNQEVFFSPATFKY